MVIGTRKKGIIVMAFHMFRVIVHTNTAVSLLPLFFLSLSLDILIVHYNDHFAVSSPYILPFIFTSILGIMINYYVEKVFSGQREAATSLSLVAVLISFVGGVFAPVSNMIESILGVRRTLFIATLLISGGFAGAGSATEVNFFLTFIISLYIIITYARHTIIK